MCAFWRHQRKGKKVKCPPDFELTEWQANSWMSFMSLWGEVIMKYRKWAAGVINSGEIPHYSDAIMSTTASQITSLTIVYSSVYSDADLRKVSKLRVTGLCEGNSLATGEFPAQRASKAENASIWWRHHAMFCRNALLNFWCLTWLFISTDNGMVKGTQEPILHPGDCFLGIEMINHDNWKRPLHSTYASHSLKWVLKEKISLSTTFPHDFLFLWLKTYINKVQSKKRQYNQFRPIRTWQDIQLMPSFHYLTLRNS